MLIFTLKKEWYEKIKNGEKIVEYREVKPYWRSRISKEFCLEDEFHEIGNSLTAGNFKHPVKLRLGYTKRELSAFISKIEIVDGKDTDLHIDKPVYAIHLEDIMTEEEFNRQQLEEKGYVCPKNIFHDNLQLSCYDCKIYKERKCKAYFKNTKKK